MAPPASPSTKFPQRRLCGSTRSMVDRSKP
jgi:hypothetical protein